VRILESPRWLISKMMRSEARDALHQIQGGSLEDLDSKVNHIEEEIKAGCKSTDAWQHFNLPSTIRALTLGCSLQVCFACYT